ncbi:heme peroxidase [Chytriomyces sp. MP71]|nr:heme peroxidase [Chytriomyces sp. MP71]
MKLSNVLSLTALLFVNNAYSLNQNDAQHATNQLWDKLRGQGGCLFSKHLSSNAPSQNLAALWLRAVFHDAGTYDASAKTGGLDASVQLTSESSSSVNKGLPGSFGSLSIRQDIPISKADAIALAGVVTLSSCRVCDATNTSESPFVAFSSGRADATSPNLMDNLPHDPFGTVDTIYPGFQRMGLNKVDMLVLVTGSHSLGGAHAAISPLLTNKTFVPFDSTPGIFDNDVFKQVLAGNCVNPFDCTMARNADLKPYVQLYASNQTAFFTQYQASFEKMLALTASPLSQPIHLNITCFAHNAGQGGGPNGGGINGGGKNGGGNQGGGAPKAGGQNGTASGGGAPPAGKGGKGGKAPSHKGPGARRGRKGHGPK